MIYQGSTPQLQAIIEGFFPYDEISVIELAVASSVDQVFIFSKDEVTYTEDTIEPAEGEPYTQKSLYFTLTQAQTFALKGSTLVQLRFMTDGGGVYASDLAKVKVHGSISHNILGDDASGAVSAPPRRAEFVISEAPAPVRIKVVEGGGGAPFNDMLELTPNNAISDSIEVDVTKKQHLGEWIRDILVTKKPPVITLASTEVTYVQGEPLSQNALTVLGTIVEGTGKVNEVTVDGVIRPLSLSFDVKYPSTAISAGTIQGNKNIVVAAKAEDGQEASATLRVNWKYRIAHKKYNGTFAEIWDGASLTIKMDQGAGSLYVSVPKTRTAPYIQDGPVKYDADAVTYETRHNLEYAIYEFKHKIADTVTYTVKY